MTTAMMVAAEYAGQTASWNNQMAIEAERGNDAHVAEMLVERTRETMARIEKLSDDELLEEIADFGLDGVANHNVNTRKAIKQLLKERGLR